MTLDELITRLIAIYQKPDRKYMPVYINDKSGPFINLVNEVQVDDKEKRVVII